MSAYTGYLPVSAADFHAVPPQKDSFRLRKDAEELHSEETPDSHIDSAGSSGIGTLYGILVTLMVIFIVALSLTASGGDCKIGLCGKSDRSSARRSGYNYENFEFIAPLKLVWMVFAVSLFGMAVSALYAILVLKIGGMSHLMADMCMYVQGGISTFLFKEMKYSSVLVVGLLIIIGFGSSWRASGSFAIGMGFAALLGWLAGGISTRGGLRTSSEAQKSFELCLHSALRTGSVIGVAVVSFTVAGLSISYFIIRDVRALIGFVGGVSSAALVTRMAGGLYKGASNVGPLSVQEIGDGVSNRDVRNPAFAASAIGDILNNIVGMAINFMATHSLAIVATAILGSSQPFFHDNVYALCVFNHLILDQTCVAYGVPTKKVSFAASICRVESIRTSYERLGLWQSNSAFVALPFVLGIVSILTAVLCSLRFLVKSNTDVETNDVVMKSRLLRSSTGRLRVGRLIGSAITVASAAGLCWGLFGGRSSFQKLNSSLVDKFELPPLSQEDAANQCRPVDSQASIELADLPLLRLRRAFYEPKIDFGRQYPLSSQIPWRTFICIFLGITLSFFTQATMGFFTSYSEPVSRWVASSVKVGPLELVIKGLGVSMALTALPMGVIVIAILASFRLFGGYGVGLCAIGFSSSVGTDVIFDALNPIAENARMISQAPFVPRVSLMSTDALSFVGSFTGFISRTNFYVSGALSSIALIAVLLQETGLLRSPRRLVGSLVDTPSRHLTDYDAFNVSEVFVLVSAILGVLLPTFCAALILASGSQASRRMVRQIENQGKTFPTTRVRESGVDTDYYLGCTELSSNAGAIESIIPVIVSVVSPLVIGFGLGQRALVGMCVGMIPTSFHLAMTLNNTSTILQNVPRLIENGYRPNGARNEDDWMAFANSASTVGRGLGECSAPSSVALMNFVPVFSVLVVSLMQPGQEKGWIGLIILAGAMVVVGVVWVLSRRTMAPQHADFGEQRTSELGDQGDVKPGLNTNFVSPFFEEGPAVRLDTINPQSEFAKTPNIAAVGFGLSGDESDAGWEPLYALQPNPEEDSSGTGTVQLNETATRSDLEASDIPVR